MKKITSRKSTQRQKQRGSAMLEFALGSLLLFPLLFGTADFGRLFYASIEVADAAAAGANYGTRTVANMTDTTGISSAATNDAQNLAGLNVASSVVCQNSSGITVNCAGASVYHYLTVTASYTFNTLFNYPVIPSSAALSKTVMMRGQ